MSLLQKDTSGMTADGAVIYAGGVLRDANVNVVCVFQFGGLSFFVSLAILFFLRPGKGTPEPLAGKSR